MTEVGDDHFESDERNKQIRGQLDKRLQMNLHMTA